MPSLLTYRNEVAAETLMLGRMTPTLMSVGAELHRWTVTRSYKRRSGRHGSGTHPQSFVSMAKCSLILAGTNTPSNLPYAQASTAATLIPWESPSLSASREHSLARIASRYWKPRKPENCRCELSQWTEDSGLEASAQDEKEDSFLEWHLRFS